MTLKDNNTAKGLPCVPDSVALHEGRQLTAVPHQDELVGHQEGGEARGEQHLGGLIHHTHVKGAPGEEHVAHAQAGGGHHGLKISILNG